MIVRADPWVHDSFGRVAELVKAPVLKTGRPKGLGGSSPSPSAIIDFVDFSSFPISHTRVVRGKTGARRWLLTITHHQPSAASLPGQATKVWNYAAVMVGR